MNDLQNISKSIYSLKFDFFNHTKVVDTPSRTIDSYLGDLWDYYSSEVDCRESRVYLLRIFGKKRIRRFVRDELSTCTLRGSSDTVLSVCLTINERT